MIAGRGTNWNSAFRMNGRGLWDDRPCMLLELSRNLLYSLNNWTDTFEKSKCAKKKENVWRRNKGFPMGKCPKHVSIFNSCRFSFKKKKQANGTRMANRGYNNYFWWYNIIYIVYANVLNVWERMSAYRSHIAVCFPVTIILDCLTHTFLVERVILML